MKLRDLMKGLMGEKELVLLPSSWDIIGNKDKAVAVVNIPGELKQYEKVIGDAIIKLHKPVKSVLVKETPRKGQYRLYELRLVAGDERTEVTHKESGIQLKLDPKVVYFSPREGAERLRLLEQIRPEETVMVFFAGIGPLPILIAKKKKAKKVVGIEINPEAVKYFKENVKLNKVDNVSALLGDVKDEAKRYYGKCDRVIMPLPETAFEYLEQATASLKPGGICNFYCFSKLEEIDKFTKLIVDETIKQNRKARILNISKVLQWGPSIWKMRIDFEVE